VQDILLIYLKNMSAGQPNWQKLHEMGRLPSTARDKVSSLVEIDKLKKQIEDFKKGSCDDCRQKFFPESVEKEFIVKCEVENCNYVAAGRTESIAKNNLRLHSKTHKE